MISRNVRAVIISRFSKDRSDFAVYLWYCYLVLPGLRNIWYLSKYNVSASHAIENAVKVEIYGAIK